jgi:hypothetical protein
VSTRATRVCHGVCVCALVRCRSLYYALALVPAGTARLQLQCHGRRTSTHCGASALPLRRVQRRPWQWQWRPLVGPLLPAASRVPRAGGPRRATRPGCASVRVAATLAQQRHCARPPASRSSIHRALERMHYWWSVSATARRAGLKPTHTHTHDMALHRRGSHVINSTPHNTRVRARNVAERLARDSVKPPGSGGSNASSWRLSLLLGARARLPARAALRHGDARERALDVLAAARPRGLHATRAGVGAW